MTKDVLSMRRARVTKSPEEALAGEEGDAGHDQEDAQPADGGDGLVKDEDGGEEAEDVADAE